MEVAAATSTGTPEASGLTARAGCWRDRPGEFGGATQPVAVAAVQDWVQKSPRHPLVSQDRAPFLKTLVRGQHRRGRLVTPVHPVQESIRSALDDRTVEGVPFSWTVESPGSSGSLGSSPCGQGDARLLPAAAKSGITPMEMRPGMIPQK